MAAERASLAVGGGRACFLCTGRELSMMPEPSFLLSQFTKSRHQMGTPLLVLIQASGMVGLLSADISRFSACFPVIDGLPGAPGRAGNCVAFSCVNILGIWHVAVHFCLSLFPFPCKLPAQSGLELGKQLFPIPCELAAKGDKHSAHSKQRAGTL